MSALDIYTLLFFDSFKGSLLFIAYKSYVFDSMGIIGVVDKFSYIVVVFGISLAALTNYLIGRVVCYYATTLVNNSNYLKGRDFFNKYLYFILIFSFIDIWGALVCTMAGIFKTDLKKFLSLVVFGNIAMVVYYVWCFNQ